MNALETTPAKPRFETLDALRGVAALIVIWYHVFEAFATSPADQNFNHAHLAVDFFFMLSGFVIGYAYDDRWRAKSMTTGRFLKRRLIRLHPMVVVGVALGVVAFLAAGSKRWDGTVMPLAMVIAACFFNIFMLPVFPSTSVDVRGNGEMFPLNGPHWSLFFEYIANILYALFARRLPTRWLAVLTGLCAIGLIVVGVGDASGYGHLGMGWTLADANLWGGLARLMFSFSAGLLMARVIKPGSVKGSFWICSLTLIIVMSVPHIGPKPWLNGLYESLVVIGLFPVLLYIGASAAAPPSRAKRFIGEISYPVYAIHYPMMYLFYDWVWTNELSFSEAWHVAAAIFFSAIILAWALSRYYDQPLRRWLSKRFDPTKKS